MPEFSQTAGALFMTAYSGAEPSTEFLTFLEKNSLAGVILFEENCRDHARLEKSIRRIQELSENRALIAIDQEGGRVCRLRGAPAEYRSAAEYAALADGDTKKRQEALAIYETEFSGAMKYLAKLGVNFLLGPVCDLKLWDGETALEGRSFGKDPELVSGFVSTSVRICHEHGLVCCLKHAPGLGRVSVDPHEKLGASAMTLQQFTHFDSLPFKAGIAAGADSLMSSHFLAPDFDDKPVTCSKTIVDTLIKNELSDSLALLSDDLNMGALSQYGSFDTLVSQCLQAGHDLLLTRNIQTAKLGVSALSRALELNEITHQRLSQAQSKIDSLKLRTAPPRV